MNPQYIKDIQQYIDNLPYGKVGVEVERVNRQTTKITTHGRETLRYTDNSEAVKDLLIIIKNLINVGYTGKTTLDIEYKSGKIKIVAIHDIKETRY